MAMESPKSMTKSHSHAALRWDFLSLIFSLKGYVNCSKGGGLNGHTPSLPAFLGRFCHCACQLPTHSLSAISLNPDFPLTLSDYLLALSWDYSPTNSLCTHKLQTICFRVNTQLHSLICQIVPRSSLNLSTCQLLTKVTTIALLSDNCSSVSLRQFANLGNTLTQPATKMAIAHWWKKTSFEQRHREISSKWPGGGYSLFAANCHDDSVGDCLPHLRWWLPATESLVTSVFITGLLA